MTVLLAFRPGHSGFDMLKGHRVIRDLAGGMFLADQSYRFWTRDCLLVETISITLGFVLFGKALLERPFLFGDSFHFRSLSGRARFNAIFDTSWIQPIALNSTLALTHLLWAFFSLFISGNFCVHFVSSCPFGDRREDTFLVVFSSFERGCKRLFFCPFGQRGQCRCHIH